MIIYIVYILIIIILILVSIIAIKAINRGIEAKKKLNNEKYDHNKYQSKKKSNK